jgi:hypothetical protein
MLDVKDGTWQAWSMVLMRCVVAGHPSKHAVVFRILLACLRPNGYVFSRDYAIPIDP